MRSDELNQFKTLGTAASVTAQVLGAAHQAYGASRLGGPAIFKSKDDRDQMIFLANTFQKHYEHAPITTKIPPCFALGETMLPGLFLINKVPAILAQHKLTPEDVRHAAFECRNGPFIQSVGYTLSSHLLVIGPEYIKLREASPLKRYGWSPYENLQVPRYHLVYVVCTLLLQLAQLPIGHDVVTEYECLHNFLIDVEKGKSQHFRTSSKVNGFYDYLSTTIKGISNILKLKKACLNRKPIGESLIHLGNLISDYENRIANYLANCISITSTPDKISTLQLAGEDLTMVDQNFLNGIFYKIANCALTKSEKELIHFLDSVKIDLPSEFNKAIQEKQVSKDQLIDDFKFLARLLHHLGQRKTHYINIGESVIRFGEETFIKSKDLKWLVDTNLLLIESFALECKEVIERIENASAKARKTINTYSNGKHFPNNTDSASFFAATIEKIREDNIFQSTKQIREKAASILQEEAPSINAVRSSLIAETQRIATQDQHIGIQFSSELTSSLNSMQEEHVACKPGPSEKHIETKEKYPTVYLLLQKKMGAVDEFNALLKQIDTEFNLVFTLLEQIRLFHDKFHALSTYPSFAELNTQLLELESVANTCRYHHWFFLEYKDLAQIPGWLKQKIDKIHKKIGQLFPEHEDSIKKEAMIEILSQGNDHYRALGENVKKTKEELSCCKDKAIKKRIDELKYGVENPTPKSLDSPAPPPHKSLETSLEKLIQQTAEATDKASLQEKLQCLSEALLEKHHRLHFWGGTTRTEGNQTYTVPKHVDLMLSVYKERIGFASTWLQTKSIQREIYRIAKDAALHPPRHCFGLFQPRDPETQRLYTLFQDAIEVAAP